MRVIGPLALLQIQRTSLKVGAKPHRSYDTAPLLAVPRMAVTPDGVLGAAAGGWLVDVHHRAHPASKNEDGLHGISLGFTAHYAAMRARFGDRIAVGVAGENLIAECDAREVAGSLSAGVAILHPDGREKLRLDLVQVAEPCRPFTGWALGKTVEPDVLKQNLQFLSDGLRGFYLATRGSAEVELGDLVAAL